MATLTCSFIDTNPDEKYTITGKNGEKTLFTLTSSGKQDVYPRTDLGADFSLTITDQNNTTIYSGTTKGGVLPQPTNTPKGYTVTVITANPVIATPPDNDVKVGRP